MICKKAIGLSTAAATGIFSDASVMLHYKPPLAVFSSTIPNAEAARYRKNLEDKGFNACHGMTIIKQSKSN